MADVPPEQKLERGCIRRFPRNENRNEGTFACSPRLRAGTRVHSPKPAFYEAALLSNIERGAVNSMLCSAACFASRKLLACSRRKHLEPLAVKAGKVAKDIDSLIEPLRDSDPRITQNYAPCNIYNYILCCQKPRTPFVPRNSPKFPEISLNPRKFPSSFRLFSLNSP